jgi:hypothetical protein
MKPVKSTNIKQILLKLGMLESTLACLRKYSKSPSPLARDALRKQVKTKTGQINKSLNVG